MLESNNDHLHSVSDGLEAVHGWPDVKLGEPVRPRVELPVVVVDDVADVGAAAVDDPVVPVEGQLVAEPRAEPGPRRELSGLAAKVLQRGVPAFLKLSSSSI